MKTSKYTNYLFEDDVYLLHNSMYPNIIKVTDEKLFPIVQEILSNKENYELSFEDDKDMSDFYDDLVRSRIIIQNETNELNLVNYYFRKHMEHQPLQVFIFPTRNCNFRCPYCYEAHEERVLSYEQYEQARQYILDKVKELNYSSVNISWFGGEPLLKYCEIVEFMENLKSSLPQNVDLIAHMTINAYLLTPEKFRKLVNVGVKSYQITIDGLKETHNLTRVLSGGYPTWDVIMDNIRSAKETNLDFRIILRTNVTNDMLKTAEKWIFYLAEMFKDDRRFQYHFETVKDLGGENLSFKFDGNSSKPIKELARLTSKYGIDFRSFKKFLVPFNMICYAANPHSIVIDSDGSLMKCTVVIDEAYNKVGCLNKGINDEIFAWWTDYELSDNCKKCSILPLCYGRKCPNSYPNEITCNTMKEYYYAGLRSYLKAND